MSDNNQFDEYVNQFDEYVKLLFSITKPELFCFSKSEQDFFGDFKKDDVLIFDELTLESFFISYMGNQKNNVFESDDESSPELYLSEFNKHSSKLNESDKEVVSKTINFIKNKINMFSLMLSSTLSSTNTSFLQMENKYLNIADDQKETKLLYSDTRKKFDETKNELIDTTKELTKAKEDLNSLLPNLLTVLSILIAIVVAVFAIYIQFFLDPIYKNNTFTNLVNSIIQVNLGRYVLSGHIIGSLMFLMFFMISRLTNRTVLHQCGKFEWKKDIGERQKDSYFSSSHYSGCADCQKRCSNISKIKNRSMYIMAFNEIMTALYLFLYCWWIFEHYINDKRYFLFTGDFWFVILLTAITVITLLVLGIVKLAKRFKNKP